MNEREAYVLTLILASKTLKREKARSLKARTFKHRGSTRKRSKSKIPIIQTHHISYNPAVTTNLFMGEHYIITLINRRTKNISKGFIECLELYVELNKGATVDLGNSQADAQKIRDAYARKLQRKAQK